MPTPWSPVEVAGLKQLMEACRTPEELLAKVRRIRPSVKTEMALEACMHRICGVRIGRWAIDKQREHHPFPPQPVTSAHRDLDVEIPVTVDLSEAHEDETKLELRLRGLQLENAGLLTAKRKLLDQLGEKEQQIAALTQLGSQQSAPIVAPKGRGEGKRRLATPVMLLSDWHVEEPVHPEQVNGLNEYNLEIAERCIERCADGFAWLTRDPRFEMREAIVWLGGDLFSGYIHEELMEQNFLSPVEACVWLQERIGKMLRRILAETSFERIIVPCNDGNHGRLTRKIRVATRTANSLEWLLYKTLAEKFADEPRLHFQIADGEWNFVDVFEHTIGFFHGDSVRYQGGVGGLLIPMRKALNEMRKYRKVDSFAFGHFHQYMPLLEMTANGSMIGLGPYSMSIKATPEPRQQAFFLIDSAKGKCMQTPIWL